MKKFFVLALAIALTAGAAYANFCARDYVPAATLLVPYAVVDLNSSGTAPDPSGYTTLLSVTNVSATAQIIHVTVWSPQSVHVVDFDEVLSGYDVWTINFRDMLTGHFDYFDTGDSFWKGTQGPDVTPFGPTTNAGYNQGLIGPYDTDDIDTSNCAFPYGYHPEYGAGILGALAYDTYALPVQFAPCATNPVFVSPSWLQTLSENPAFFYVTIDVVRDCNQLFPDSGTYFSQGYPTDDNVLIGEVVYLNTAMNYSEAMPAVHIEAAPFANSGSSFYCLAVGGDACTYDDREPLATAFAFRYYNSGGVSSQLLAWKNISEVGYDRSLGDYAYACEPYIYFAWNEDEESKSRGTGPSGFANPEPNVIPFETQAVPLTAANFTGLMDGNGWVLFVFDPSIPYNFQDDFAYEAWMGVRYQFAGFSAGLEAATMANVWCFPGQQLPYLSTSAYYGTTNYGGVN